MDNQELELIDGFRRLCPADKNTVMTAVSMAVSAEDAVRRQMGTLPSAPACATCGNQQGGGNKDGIGRVGQ
jgi:hypothetical protein